MRIPEVAGEFMYSFPQGGLGQGNVDKSVEGRRAMSAAVLARVLVYLVLHEHTQTDTNTQQMSRCARGMARTMSGRCRGFPETAPTCGILVWLFYSVQVHGKHVSV